MIKGKSTYLRSFELEDFDKVWDWLNNSETMFYASSNPYAVIPKDKLIKSYLNPVNTKIFAICTNDGELIGEISYWIPNRLFPTTVEMGTIIGDKGSRNIGYGFESSILLGEVIFNQLNVHRVTIYISEHNFMSKIPLDKSWVTKEGVIRKERFINGKFYDTLVYGVLRDEFYLFRKKYMELID